MHRESHMHQRSDDLLARRFGAVAAAALALLAGACSHSGQTASNTNATDNGVVADSEQNDTTTSNEGQASGSTASVKQSNAKRTASRTKANGAESSGKTNTSNASVSRNERTETSSAPSSGATAFGSSLPGLTEGDLGPAGSPDDTSENLFQATFGREGADFDPDISRDGKWLVFASTQHRATSDLYVKNINGQTVTQLTNDGANDVMPSFSPDGKRVAFTSNRSGSWDVYVMGSSGGQPIQLTSEPSHELHPTWSPDGRSLAFCRLNPGSGKWEIWTVDVASPGVTRFLAHGLLPEWNPVNDTIAFQKPRERGGRFYSVWTIQFNGGEATNPTEIAGDPEYACVSPTWSPDGERLVYAAVANPGGPIVGGLGFQPSESQLWMVNVDGTGKSRLTEGSFVNVMPRWGGDGRVYFVSNRAGVENIWGLTPERAIQTASFDPSGATPGSDHNPGKHGVTMPAGHGTAQGGHGTPAKPSTAHAAPTKAPMTGDEASDEHETASAPAGEDSHDDHE